MSTYTKTTNFTAKDNLTSGDPAKVIKGSEFDTEFNAIETAVNSKADKNNGSHTGTTTISTANIDTLQIDGVAVTATSAELNTLDGITASTSELNITDGLTASTSELNILDGATLSTAELNVLDGFTGSTAELNYVDGVTSNIQTQLDGKQPLDAQLTDIAGLTPTDGTFIVGNGTNFVAESGDTAIASLGITATATELNTLDGITATTAELNITDGLTATTAELNVLDGITATTTELNYTDGVTANIQTQLDAMVEKAGDTMTGDLSFGDNVKAKFGASDDLQIYHDGSNSYIGDFGTGNLNIRGANLQLQDPDGYNYITAVDNGTGGEIVLYHNNSGKLTTTSTGVDVTGTVTADGLTVSQDIAGLFRNTFSNTNTAGNQQTDINFSNNGDNLYMGLHYTGGDNAFLDFRGASDFLILDEGIERLRIDSNGRLGIGSTAPTADLHIKGTNAELDIENNTGRRFRIQSTTANSLSFIDKTVNSERARIDSSGNLLVGKTSTALSVAGTTLFEDGTAYHTVSGNTTMRLNRLASDGDIIDLRKDGSTVGSIGSYNTELTIFSPAGGDCGMRIGYNAIKPANSTGANADATHNLGEASGRWKDLYLSGGVYLGGTGSANKLDDYEEGTWTPTIGGTTTAGTGTYAFQNGSYVKVGNLVTINAYFRVSSHTGTGSISITNLPYVVASGSNQYSAINVGECVNLSKSADTFLTGYTIPNSTEILLRQISTGSTTSVSNIPMDTGFDILISCTYQTA